MRRPVKSEDLLNLTFVADPQLSPDLSQVAVVTTRIVKGDKNGEDASAGADSKKEPPRYQSRIALFKTEGEEEQPPLELTRGEFSDTAPRFSPDGSEVAFLRVKEKGARPQLHVISTTGGEARALTTHKAGAQGHAWHPSGEQLAYLSRGDYQDKAAEEGTPRRITKRRWRQQGQGFVPEVAPDLYLIDLATGESTKLAELAEPAGNLTFSPDGRTIYLTSSTPEGTLAEPRGDLLSVDVDSGTVTKLVAGWLGLYDAAPAPDGERLAFFAAKDQQDFVSGAGLWLLELREGAPEPRLISGEFDVQHSAGGDSRYGALPGSPTWVGADSLLVITNREGQTNLVRVSTDGEVTDSQQNRERVVTAFSAKQDADGATISAFLAETPVNPAELYLLTGDSERRLSTMNDGWRAELELQVPEGPFPAGEADAPYWVIDPVAPREDRAAVVQVHGGPHTNYGYGFNFEFQLLASRGFAVIFGNPRGSSSYGFTFATAMLGDYGSVDADDVMAFATEGAKRLGRENAPLHLTGGSYGGFMTNWLVGQTDRFTSAVTQRSISNWTSMYGTSDIGPFFVERQVDGVPWGDADALWRQSPLKYADRIVTPLLIIHSEEDFRCPIEQAEQLYAVLKRLGKAETEFLRVPGESHELSRSGRPDRRLARLDAIVDWFERNW